MKHKVLVIEDDRDLIAALSIRLRAEKFDVFGATDAYAALQTAQRARPDLILLDVGLPGGDGLSVLRRIKSLTHLALIPVVIMTARDREVWERQAMEMGADAFVDKPIDTVALLSIMRRLLPEGREETHAAATRHKLMLVEDDADTRLGLALHLKSAGFDVVTSADATSAITVAVRESPELILMDLGMPGGDGFMLLERIQSNAQLMRIPVIVLSARPAATNENRALQAGAVGYIEKPVGSELLLTEIRKHLDLN